MENKNEINGKKIAREFSFDEKKFIILEPTLNILRESKYKYSNAYTAAAKAGLYSQKKLETLLREEQSDVIDDFLSRRAELLKNLTDTQDLLEKAQDPNEILALAEMVKICREGLVREEMSMNNIFAITIEQLAEEDRVNFLTYSLVKDAEGKDIWKSFETFLDDNNFSFIDACKYNVYCWDFKVDPLWRNSLPEELAIEKAKKLMAETVEKAEPVKQEEEIKAEVKREKKPAKKKKEKTNSKKPKK